jgi:prephenate dehydrogenase
VRALLHTTPAGLNYSVLLQKVTIVGVGLLGGSVGLAIKRRQLASKVIGYVRRPMSIIESTRVGAVDYATCDLQVAVAHADLVILCSPLAQMKPLVEQMLPALQPGALVTDVGSVKQSVVDDLESIVAGAKAHFVGSHPMAGSEKTGVEAARADLFDEAMCVVTPTANSFAGAVDRIEQFWKDLGARVLRMSPETHDDLVSRSSHLPHVVAAGLANYILSPTHPREQSTLCANGFKDTTRVAAGSPEMWRDIAMANRKNLARVLGVFIDDLHELQLAIENNDEKTIAEFFQTAKQRRDQWRRSTTPAGPTSE